MTDEELDKIADIDWTPDVDRDGYYRGSGDDVQRLVAYARSLRTVVNAAKDYRSAVIHRENEAIAFMTAGDDADVDALVAKSQAADEAHELARKRMDEALAAMQEET